MREAWKEAYSIARYQRMSPFRPRDEWYDIASGVLPPESSYDDVRRLALALWQVIDDRHKVIRRGCEFIIRPVQERSES